MFPLRRSLVLAFWLAACVGPTMAASPLASVPYAEGSSSPGSFPLVDNHSAATLLVDETAWPGVFRAAKNLQQDVQRVTGVQPGLERTASTLTHPVVIIGTLGKSRTLDALAKAGKIDLQPLAGKWESYFLQVVPDPFPGVPSALVIAGSDKRGTIFGIYDLSENIGVSPWHFWADAQPRHQDALFVKNGIYRRGEPSVKYRGIFLNDEAPDLSGWVREKYGAVPGHPDAANYNSEFYEHVFDLLLRLKANYLWPAMWNNAFNEDDPKNAALADDMGIVMGTSHQEPMLRAQKEWDRRHKERWNYYKDASTLQEFWKEGITRNKNFEGLITMGLRGANDTEMIPGGTVDQNKAMLHEIIDVQRRIISDAMNPDPSKVPQLWCPYKEVLEFYDEGFRVPEDITLLWTDDNWGNIRRVPAAEERGRAGGAGIYYHFDYVGGVRNYKWLNTNYLPKIWEQMTWAKQHGADRVWIANVGHLRGLELPIDYFMHLAWDTNRWGDGNTRDFTRRWAEREFGADHASEIADILVRYTRYNNRRKPELLDPATYSQVDYQEADRVVAEYNVIAAKAQALYDQLPPEQRDAFYQLVLFPTKACAQVNEMYVAAGRNALYAQQGRASTNDWARKVETLFKADAALMAEYNARNNGRWNHFMDQTHIGYTSWNDPKTNVMPAVKELQLPEAAAMGAAVEGSRDSWPASGKTPPSLPRIDSFNRQERTIDLFNRGQTAFDFVAKVSAPWILLSKTSGRIEKEERLVVSVDWTKAPDGVTRGEIQIVSGDQTVPVTVEAFHPTDITPDTLEGFVEGDGVVSIEAEHATRAVSTPAARFERIPDYGHTLSAMTALPMTAPSVDDPANGPRLEYKIYLFTTGKMKLTATVSPSLNTLPDRGLRLAVSFDDQPPQVLTIVPKGYDAQKAPDWGQAVIENCRRVSSTHTLSTAGYHTLMVWMVDPGVVLEKLVLDTGGLKPSSLGPPESFHRPPLAPSARTGALNP